VPVRSRASLLAATGVLLALIAVETRVARAGGVGPGRYRLLALILLWWALALGGSWLLLRARPARVALGLVFAGLVALHVAAFTRGSQISDDLYRYAWDGRVQAAGIDPYRYPPAAPELRQLRDPWLWPDAATCDRLGKRDAECSRINRPRERTIYPPVAEAWFTVVHLLPGGNRERHQQLYAGLVSLGLTGLLVALLRRRGRDPRLAALYAWSPLAGLDIASDAHVDVLAVLLGIAALTLLARRRPALGGLLLGAAVAVKLYPALLLPAALRRRPLVVGGTAAAVVAASYLPHVLAVGPRVLGYLPGYLREEHYEGGGRFVLLSLLGLSGRAATAAAVLILLAVTGAVLRSSPARVPVTGAALWTVGAALLVANPVQPWYSILLVALAILEGRPEWLAVAVAAYPTYFTALLLHAPAREVGGASYAAAALVVLVASVMRSRRASGSSMGGRRQGW